MKKALIHKERRILKHIRKTNRFRDGGTLKNFFSWVDTEKPGAGTKLLFDVIGLFGVTNSVSIDLRPGVPGKFIHVINLKISEQDSIVLFVV